MVVCVWLCLLFGFELIDLRVNLWLVVFAGWFVWYLTFVCFWFAILLGLFPFLLRLVFVFVYMVFSIVVFWFGC